MVKVKAKIDFFYRNYNKKCLDNKLENKLMLQRQLGLPQRADVPMIGLVSRLTHQKGCDLIINIIDRLRMAVLNLTIFRI